MTEETKKEPGLLTDLEERVEELEARVKLNCPGCQEREDKINLLQQQFTTMQMAMKEIMARNMCEHEPICLPSAKGPVPMLLTQIADERKMTVVAPGRPPPIVFAIAICKKCGLPYAIINKLAEAQPFEGGPAPVPLVKPGEPVGGTGDL